MKTVTIYYSSIPGSTKIRKETSRTQDILSAKKIAFEMVDVAVEDNKNIMQKISGKTAIPQIVVEGEFKGLFEEFELANEDGLVEEFLFTSKS